MDQPNNPYGEPTAPAAPEAQPMRRMSRVALGVGLAAFLGMAGAGVAFAVSGGSTSSSSASGSSATNPTTPNGSATTPGGRFRGPAGAGMGAMGMRPMGGKVLYGQYTVEVPASSSGSSSTPTYKTIDVQVGTASVSSDGKSITVTSTDGHSQTYAVVASTIVDAQAGGISTVGKGDTVRIEGLVQGSTVTATNIVDSSKIGSSRQGFGFGPERGPLHGGNAPAPASSAGYSNPA